MTGSHRHHGTDRRRGGSLPLDCAALILTLAALVIASIVTPRSTSAHAFVKESDPAANAILATAPAQITLRFTEHLERSYSKADLYNQTGKLVPGAKSRAGDDASTMVIDLTGGLANGTYSVLWQSLSADDGHTAQGYFAFTVGTQADVRTIVPPPATTTGGPPDSLRAIAKWLAFLGLAVSVAVWPIWLFVLRPAISPAWQLGPALTRRVRKLAAGAIAFALVANVTALAIQAAGVAGSAGLVGALTTTLFETRFGALWLVRVGLYLVYAAALVEVAWWRPRWRPVAALLATALAALLPLPFSLIAHASAQPAGRATAILADLLHLVAASLWAGGLVVLVVGLVPTLRDLTPAGQRAVLGRAIPRFSTIALVAWGVLGLTGFYSAWLQVGNLTGLRQTVYGHSLTLKLVLLVPVLILAAFNLLIVTKRLRDAHDERAAAIWSGRFVAAIAAEAILVVLILLVVGRLTGQAPARETLEQEAGHLTIPLSANGQQATLSITPGVVGPNHYRLELGSGHDHSTTKGSEPVEALLRVELPDRNTGQKQIDLIQAAGDAFEGHGSELGIAGTWTITVIVRQAGQNDWMTTVTRPIGTSPPPVNVPGPPWRFGPVGIPGLLLLILGIAGVVMAARTGRSPLRKESAGLGTVALVIGVVLLLQARVSPGSSAQQVAAAPDPAAVVRGGALFAQNCAACHGTGGKGDGRAGASLNPPPADLTAVHARSHSDADLAFWITQGIQGSAMPAFSDTLSDNQIQDVISYLRDLEAKAGTARDAPGAETCRVTPRSLDSIRALAHTPLAAGLASPPAVPPGAGVPADPATVAAVTAAARELVACSNTGDVLRRLALYSDANVRAAFPDGPSATFAKIAEAPSPVPDTQRVALSGVSEVRTLPDGRASAIMAIDNPLKHSHALVATPGANPQREVATIVFVHSGDRWLVDQVQH